MDFEITARNLIFILFRCTLHIHYVLVIKGAKRCLEYLLSAFKFGQGVLYDGTQLFVEKSGEFMLVVTVLGQ